MLHKIVWKLKIFIIYFRNQFQGYYEIQFYLKTSKLVSLFFKSVDYNSKMYESFYKAFCKSANVSKIKIKILTFIICKFRLLQDCVYSILMCMLFNTEILMLSLLEYILSDIIFCLYFHIFYALYLITVVHNVNLLHTTSLHCHVNKCVVHIWESVVLYLIHLLLIYSSLEWNRNEIILAQHI